MGFRFYPFLLPLLAIALLSNPLPISLASSHPTPLQSGNDSVSSLDFPSAVFNTIENRYQRRKKRELISAILIPITLELLKKENREEISNFVTSSTVHRKIKEGFEKGWNAVKSLWPWGK